MTTSLDRFGGSILLSVGAAMFLWRRLMTRYKTGLPSSICSCSRLAIALAIGGAFFSPIAVAQQGPAPATAEEAASAPASAETIVVTGSAQATTREKIGNALTVVDKSVIEEGGYTYVPDVLRQVPGLAVNQGGAPGALTQVRTRGSEGNHTLVLLDGVDISSPDQGETDFSTLLSGDLQQIEVLRGPQSGLYGSNALAGVVNLITRKNVDGWYSNVGLEAGEQGAQQLQANGGFGDGADYLSAGFQALRSEGYDISPDTAAQGVPAVGVGGERGDREGNQLATVYVRGGKAFAPIFRVDGFVNFLNKHTDLDGQAYNFPIAGKTYDDASEVDAERLLAAGSATLSLLDGRWETIFSASYQDEERRGQSTSFPYADPVFGPPAPTAAALAAINLSPSGADSTRTKATLQSTFEFGSDGFLSYLTGFAEAKEETYQNAFPASPAQAPEQERNLVGLGAQYRAEIANQIFLSATYRHNDNDDFKDDDTYSVAAAWAIPNIGTRPHASIGTGVTNPTFTEQFGFNPGTFVGNPNLVPEESEGWDIGVEQTLLDGRVVLDLTYFEATLENEIYTAFGPPPGFLSTPANRTTDSDRSGWELSFNLQPIDDLSIIGAWTKLDATEPAGIEVRRPEDTGSLDASWRVMGGPVRVNLGVTYNGDQTDTDFGTFLRTAQDPYTLVRLGASWQVNDTVELYARVQNLTDETYEEVIGVSGAPRAAFIGVRFKAGTAK